MKKISKWCSLSALVLLLGLLCFNNKVYAQSNEDYTMDEVKQMLDVYLENNHPEIVFGTTDYSEYLVEQLVEGTDSNLKKEPNVELILDYASIYLYEIEESTVATYSISDTTNYNMFKDKTLGELIDEIGEEESNIENVPMQQDSIGPARTYNVADATAYARTWANSFNPNYAQQSSDCTNFVSQILSAGGLYGIIPQHSIPSGITSDTSYWYYLNSKQMSTSFIRVVDFYTFYASRVVRTETASRATAVYNMREGDVVLLKRATTGARYHAIYISKVENGKAYYCGHTSARKDYAFDNIDDSSNDYTVFKFNAYKNN